MFSASTAISERAAIVYVAHISLFAYWKSFIAAGFFLLSGLVYASAQFLFHNPLNDSASLYACVILFGIGLAILSPPLIAKVTTELVITNRLISLRFGFFRKRVIKLDHGDIKSITLDQGSLGRVLNYGRLVIVCMDESNRTQTTQIITPPLEFHQILDDILEEYTDIT